VASPSGALAATSYFERPPDELPLGLGADMYSAAFSSWTAGHVSCDWAASGIRAVTVKRPKGEFISLSKPFLFEGGRSALVDVGEWINFGHMVGGAASICRLDRNASGSWRVTKCEAYSVS
jgi:hypothetical protein